MTNHLATSRTRRLVYGGLAFVAVAGVLFLLIPGLAMLGVVLMITLGGGQVG